MPPSLSDLVSAHNIQASATYGAPDNPTFRNADPWTVRLVRKDGKHRRSLTVPFYKGFGHGGAEPETRDVLSCLLSDAGSVEEARSFEDWCETFGYDTDSRKAEAAYRACERITRNLRRFLADDYDAFMLAGSGE